MYRAEGPASVGEKASEVRTNALDEAEAADPFEDMERWFHDEQHMGPPEEEAEESQKEALLEDGQPPPVLVSELPRCSWWQRLGETIEKSSLVIGGATLHHSHIIAAFGNPRCALVFCCSCGGSTQGSFSPLLAEPCRKQANTTRQRQVTNNANQAAMASGRNGKAWKRATFPSNQVPRGWGAGADRKELKWVSKRWCCERQRFVCCSAVVCPTFVDIATMRKFAN